MCCWWVTAGSIAASRRASRFGSSKTTPGCPWRRLQRFSRQEGDYKKAAKALSEGQVEEAFTELDKLGWIREVDDSDRDQQLAASYLAAVAETKKDGKPKTAPGRIAGCAPKETPHHRICHRWPSLKADGQT